VLTKARPLALRLQSSSGDGKPAGDGVPALARTSNEELTAMAEKPAPTGPTPTGPSVPTPPSTPRIPTPTSPGPAPKPEPGSAIRD
jgi:hypothetical protein